MVWVTALCAAPGWTSTPPNKAAGAAQAKAVPEDFVGAEKCDTCHGDVAKQFTGNPHSKLTEEHGKADMTCESCHGAGKAHSEGGGDKSKIFNAARVPAKEADEKCLGCHRGRHIDFARSAHAEGKVSCVSCHSVHAGADKGHMLKAEQPALCYRCHTDIKPQFGMPFHHKVEEGLMTCSDCHDPHGKFERRNLKNASQQDALCTRCHGETAGPFVYEHPAVKTEGCGSCHFPHSGPNPRLLKRDNVNTLCLQCHSPSANSTAAEIPAFHSQKAQYQACTDCHTHIHGSNSSAIFLNSAE